MNKEERLISLCQEAVRIPSMSGQEKQVAELMKHTMTSYGFDEVNIDSPECQCLESFLHE